MIGSPASRGAVASGGAGGRACLAAASGISTVSAAIAASVTMAGGPQRRVATADCAVINRFTMLSPVEMPLRACVDQVSDRDFGITNGRHYPRQFAPGVIGTFRRQISHIRQTASEEGWLGAEIGTNRTWRYVRVIESGMRSIADLEHARLKSRSHVSGLCVHPLW